MIIAQNTAQQQLVKEHQTTSASLAGKSGAPVQASGAPRSAPCAPSTCGRRLVDCYGQTYPSRYNVFIPIKGGRRLVYNAFTGKLTVWAARGVDVYNNFAAMPCTEDKKAIADQLLDGGYLVRKGQDQYAEIKKVYETNRFNPKRMTLSIAPTMSCNFSCDYCFQGDRKAKAVMKPEVQDALVAFVEKSMDKLNHLHTAWYGGEPMLRWQTIYSLADRLIDLCNANGVNYSAMMVTNGYLLTQKKAERLYRRRVKTIQITLDGPPEQHNKRRSLKGGGPTFDSVVENIKKIVGVIPIRIAVRINVDARNCDLASMDRLFRILVDNGLANQKNFGVYFAPVEAITKECHQIADSVLAKEAYANMELELYRMAIRKKVAGHRYPPRFFGTCAAVRPNGYVVLPDGAMHKCWDTISSGENAVGSVFDTDKVPDNEVYKKWLDWSPFNIEECKQCVLLPNCAGACAYKMLYHKDTAEGQRKAPCLSWRYQIKTYLLMWAISRKIISIDDVLLTDRTAKSVEKGNTAPAGGSSGK
ncbi:MAG: SPASM domain-containing protein [Desulfobacteraceae bacterium]|jgi:uncharacterized protein